MRSRSIAAVLFIFTFYLTILDGQAPTGAATKSDTKTGLKTAVITTVSKILTSESFSDAAATVLIRLIDRLTQRPSERDKALKDIRALHSDLETLRLDRSIYAGKLKAYIEQFSKNDKAELKLALDQLRVSFTKVDSSAQRVEQSLRKVIGVVGFLSNSGVTVSAARATQEYESQKAQSKKVIADQFGALSNSSQDVDALGLRQLEQLLTRVTANTTLLDRPIELLVPIIQGPTQTKDAEKEKKKG